MLAGIIATEEAEFYPTTPVLGSERTYNYFSAVGRCLWKSFQLRHEFCRSIQGQIRVGDTAELAIISVEPQ